MFFVCLPAVVRGRITSVEHSEPLDRSALFIRADRVIRQTNDIFRPATQLTVGDAPAGDLSNHISERYRPALLDSLSDSAAAAGAGAGAHEWHGHVHVARHCGAHEGRGQYVLMGRHRLGVPMVTCTLAADDWRRIRTDAERAGTNECVLEG